MNLSQLEKIGKALADETRLRIFEAISANSGIVCGDLVTLQGVTPATISHHLKILLEAGLIQCQKEGQFVRSRVKASAIAQYTSALKRMVSSRKKAPRKS
jgi:ArsR family transcriptional regulator, arsenate/arsenite/antimonite-responsive transcriptional repressor